MFWEPWAIHINVYVFIGKLGNIYIFAVQIEMYYIYESLKNETNYLVQVKEHL